MTVQGGRFIFGFVLAVGLATQPALAGTIVPVSNPHEPAVIGAVVRNGTNSYVGGVFQAHPLTLEDSFNAPGNSFRWQSETLYKFEVTYTASTGAFSLMVDFPAFGNQLEVQKTIAVVFPEFKNEGFEFIRIAAKGNDSSTATISHLSINGDSESDIGSGDGHTVRFFGDSNTGTFLNNIDVTGTFRFSGAGGSDASLPRFTVNLVNVDPPPAPLENPEPASLVVFGMLAVLGGGYSWSRRRSPMSA